MTSTPLLINLYGHAHSQRYHLAARLVHALERVGMVPRFAIPELAVIDPEAVPTPDQQVFLARSLLQPLANAYPGQVIIVPDPVMSHYARAPFQFDAVTRPLLDELRRLHHQWPSLNLIVSRPVSQEDRDGQTRQLTNQARDRLALDAQVEQTLREEGIQTQVYVNRNDLDFDELITDVGQALGWEQPRAA